MRTPSFLFLMLMFKTKFLRSGSPFYFITFVVILSGPDFCFEFSYRSSDWRSP